MDISDLKVGDIILHVNNAHVEYKILYIDDEVVTIRWQRSGKETRAKDAFGHCCLSLETVSKYYSKRPVIREGWINIYPRENDERTTASIKDRKTSTAIYSSKEEAEKTRLRECIATVPVQWEE